MKVLVTGSSGLIGSTLIPLLKAKNYEIYTLVRHSPQSETEIFWDYENENLDASKLEGIDVIVHLAGKNIADNKWTEKVKEEIKQSRIKGTNLLIRKLLSLTKPPSTFIAASAIGFYGNRGNEILSESSLPGSGYLAKLCQDWENTTKTASNIGLRTVNIRFGVVLSKKGGALSKMLLPFLFGAGGPIGSGKQYMSWIAVDDAVGAIDHIINNASIDGPVNLVSPNPILNKDFAHTLGKVLQRPAILPLPAFAAQLLLGEMANELLLSSQRVEPSVLKISNYKYKYPNLESALKHILN
jgi:uncharacterized protein (TIGR01777 family)